MKKFVILAVIIAAAGSVAVIAAVIHKKIERVD